MHRITSWNLQLDPDTTNKDCGALRLLFDILDEEELIGNYLSLKLMEHHVEFKTGLQKIDVEVDLELDHAHIKKWDEIFKILEEFHHIEFPEDIKVKIKETDWELFNKEVPHFNFLDYSFRYLSASEKVGRVGVVGEGSVTIVFGLPKRQVIDVKEEELPDFTKQLLGT